MFQHPQLGRFGDVGALLGVQAGRQHYVPGHIVQPPQQTAPGRRLAQLVLRLGVLPRQQQRDDKGRLVAGGMVPAAETVILVVDFLVDDFQFGGKAVHGQRLEHVADDVVLDGLLGVLEIVKAAEKGDVHGGAYLPHLPGQLDARNKGHPDVGEQQVRLQLLHQLQCVQPVAGASRQMKAQRLPRDHGADSLPQFGLVIRNHHSVKGFFRHTVVLHGLDRWNYYSVPRRFLQTFPLYFHSVVDKRGAFRYNLSVIKI